jgi:dTDP-D-glucose 4,6-dehydratase
LNDLFGILRNRLAEQRAEIGRIEPVYGPFRQGDVLHSLADITKARTLLGFEPIFHIEEGLKETVSWFLTKKDQMNQKDQIDRTDQINQTDQKDQINQTNQIDKINQKDQTD